MDYVCTIKLGMVLVVPAVSEDQTCPQASAAALKAKVLFCLSFYSYFNLKLLSLNTDLGSTHNLRQS